MLAETCLIWFWYRTSPYPLPPNIANHLWIIYEWELLSSLVANAVKRFFTLKYYTSDMLHQADFAYTHKDSNNNDSYQVVEWRNWPRRLKKYITSEFCQGLKFKIIWGRIRSLKNYQSSILGQTCQKRVKSGF